MVEDHERHSQPQAAAEQRNQSKARFGDSLQRSNLALRYGLVVKREQKRKRIDKGAGVQRDGEDADEGRRRRNRCRFRFNCVYCVLGRERIYIVFW